MRNLIRLIAVALVFGAAVFVWDRVRPDTREALEMEPAFEALESMPPDDFPMEEPIIITETGDQALFHVVRLLFATNRALSNAPNPATPADQFTADDGDLIYGVAEVSIPENHEVGHLESQGFLAALFVDPDPEKHVILQNMDVQSVETVMALLNEEVANGDASTLFYIHGFNTGVDTAARRSGQLTYDLNWRGPSFFFSWPSQDSALSYISDQRLARGSRSELQQVFEEIAATDTDNIVVIAHSMGTDLLTQALELMEARNSPALAKIKTVILAAPDIDEEIFREDIVPAIDRIDDIHTDFRVTVYASAGDRALDISEVKNGALRIGVMSDLTTEQADLLAPVKMVNASAAETNFFGHTYINDNPSVIEDVYCMLYDSIEPQGRGTLEGVPEPDGPIFRIRSKSERNAPLDNDGPGAQFNCD